MSHFHILSDLPEVAFPIDNEVTGNTLYVVVGKGAYGAVLNVYAQPIISQANLSSQYPIVTIHLDYWAKDEEGIKHETLRALCWDETAAQNGDVPTQDVILCDDVQRAINTQEAFAE